MRVVVAIPAGGLIAGCAAGLCWPGLPPWILYALLLEFGFIAALAFRETHGVLLAASVAAAFGAGGALLASSAWQEAWRPTLRIAFESMALAERAEAAVHGRQLPLDDAATVALVGVLREDASPGDAGASLSVDVTGVTPIDSRDRATGADAGRTHDAVRGGAILTVNGALAFEHIGEWRSGRRIAATATLRRPSRYLDPGVADNERALARHGTTLVGTVKSGALVDVMARGSPAAEAAASARAFARRAIQRSVGRFSPRSAAIVTAIVIGDRSGLDEELQRQLQEAGTYHVIAISGGNIAILAALALLGFRLAGFLGRSAMVCAIVALSAYGYVVGGGASVDRATLMAVVYFAGRALDLRGPPLNMLSLAAGVLVLIDPLVVADPAFLLTFGATAAILLVMPVVPISTLHRFLAPAAAMLAASVAAELALLPVAATFFSRVTFAGLLLNFAAMPLMALAQVAGMAVLPLFMVSEKVAAGAGWLAHIGAEGLVRSAELVEWTPALTWRVPPPSPAAILIYYLGLVIAWAAWRWGSERGRMDSPVPIRGIQRAAMSGCLVAALWILAAPVPFAIWPGGGRLRVTFIDVGQGDAALVRFPRGSAIEIDAGGLGGRSSFDIGDRVVAPVLRQAGVRQLDTLVLTHGDADHIGGATALMRDLRPWDIWEGVPVPPFEPLQRLGAEAGRRRIRWSNVQTGDVAMVDGVRVVVRHPVPPDWERQDVRNDDSIVIELLWGDVSVVLTGDIGREVEHAILPQFAPVPLRVIKVPHHGSLTSSSNEFVQQLAPRVAVVSVGRSNAFGHPAPAVLQRYQDAGAAIFRTDQDGAVNVDTDGTSLEVSTFTGRKSLIVQDTKPVIHHSHENTKTRKLPIGALNESQDSIDVATSAGIAHY